jgi:hypothetical protein
VRNLGDVVPQVITHPVGVPHRPLEKVLNVLNTVRIGVSGMLSDGPTVLPRQISLQPEDEPARSTTDLGPS